MTIQKISPQELQQRRQQGSIDLIDVRTPVEYAEIHIEGSRLIPLDTLTPDQLVAQQGDRALCIICRSGGRAAKAYEKLRAAGVQNIQCLEGGTMAWEQAGLPVVRGPRVMSLERQVRIAAGTLVLLGVALGWLVHPGFLGLSAFVGGGLVFAGLTDTCGMGLLLARMPWNRRKNCSTDSAS